MGGTWGNPMATSTPAPGYYGNSGSGFSGGSGMTQIQQMVLNTISGCTLDQGISIYELIKKVGQHGFGGKNIKAAVAFHYNEGHIYSTIDDEHFKLTDA